MPVRKPISGDDVQFGGLVVATQAVNDLAQKVTIFPNPARDIITIDLSEIPAVETEITFFDANGKSLFFQQLNVNQTTISTSNLVNGIYWVRVKNGKQSIFKKLIIQK